MFTLYLPFLSMRSDAGDVQYRYERLLRSAENVAYLILKKKKLSFFHTLTFLEDFLYPHHSDPILIILTQ